MTLVVIELNRFSLKKVLVDTDQDTPFSPHDPGEQVSEAGSGMSATGRGGVSSS